MGIYLHESYVSESIIYCSDIVFFFFNIESCGPWIGKLVPLP